MTKEKKNSLSYVKIFIAIFTFIFFIAILFKAYESFVNRQFTGNVFNILVVSDKYVGVLGVDEAEKRLNAALVTKDLTSAKKRNILSQSINFAVPIHAYIVYPEAIEAPPPTRNFFSIENIQKISTDAKIDKKNISLFDWLKLYFIAKKINDDMIDVKTYASIRDVSQLLPQEEESFFRDSKITGRKTSLQVVNGTTINGLGNRVGDMFSRTGFNVVSVITNSAEESAIYYSDENALEDAKFISKSFNFPLIQSNEHRIASITLVIGEDQELLLEDLSF